MNKENNVRYIAVVYAILAALFYGFSVPISKILLTYVSPYLMSSLLYFGAGLGMLIVVIIGNKRRKTPFVLEFTKNDLKYIIMMIILDIIAPILLMIGLTKTMASTTSLLNNFEIVFTGIIAMIFFKEVVGKKMWISIFFIVLAGILLTFKDFTGFQISVGSLFVIGASLSWGLENNCTRMLSKRNPLHIVVIKGLGSGLGAFIIALSLNQFTTIWYYAVMVLVLGFFSYGMSLYYYIHAQRHLGAARTSAYYSIAPFAGAVFSFLVLGETLSLIFGVAFTVMVIGTYLAIKENNSINTKSNESIT